MNIRFDTESVRIRVSSDEALKLQSAGSYLQAFPIGGVTLEVYMKQTEDLELDDSLWPRLRIGVSESAVKEILERVDSKKSGTRKKDEWSVRNVFINPRLNVDLIFEVDLFDRIHKERKNGR